ADDSSTSDPVAATVHNIAAVPLQVDAIQAPAAPFAISGGDCPAAPFQLPPGASCSIAFVFGPGLPGAADSALVHSTDPSSPHRILLRARVGTDIFSDGFDTD